MTNEERKAKLAEAEEEYERLMSTPLPRAKPKPKPMLALEVSERSAVNARARPERVKVVTTGEDDVTHIDRPRRTEMLEVLEVDGQGRPALAPRYDALTGERSLAEVNQGYRQGGGPKHEYNPFAALRKDD